MANICASMFILSIPSYRYPCSFLLSVNNESSKIIFEGNCGLLFSKIFPLSLSIHFNYFYDLKLDEKLIKFLFLSRSEISRARFKKKRSERIKQPSPLSRKLFTVPSIKRRKERRQEEIGDLARYLNPKSRRFLPPHTPFCRLYLPLSLLS